MSVILLRTLIFFVLLNIGMRLMGKRQIGEIQLTEFITAVMLSELALLPITDTDTPFLYGVFAMLTLCSLEVISAYACRRLPSLRRAVEGRPLVLVSGGHFVGKNLAAARISTDELFAAIRGAGLRGPEEVSYVILEQTGALSVIPKQSAVPPTAEDLSLNVESRGISHPVIIDGEIQERTLGQTGKDRRWLEKQLSEKGLCREELLYFCVDDCDNVSFERRGGKK